MPTGYTAYIEDGQITTGKKFLLLCSRGFGVAIDLKDEPLNVPTPTKFEPNKWYKDQLDKSLKHLEKITEMSMEEVKGMMIDDFDNNKKSISKCLKEANEKKTKYEKVCSEVESWIPPTEEHKGIKDFALEQIDMCVESERDISRYMEELQEELIVTEDGVKKYYNDLLSNAKWKVEYYTEKWEGEKELAAKKTKFMEDFVKSLENM